MKKHEKFDDVVNVRMGTMARSDNSEASGKL
jgi:hypothetical protein